MAKRATASAPAHFSASDCRLLRFSDRAVPPLGDRIEWLIDVKLLQAMQAPCDHRVTFSTFPGPVYWNAVALSVNWRVNWAAVQSRLRPQYKHSYLQCKLGASNCPIGMYVYLIVSQFRAKRSKSRNACADRWLQSAAMPPAMPYSLYQLAALIPMRLTERSARLGSDQTEPCGCRRHETGLQAIERCPHRPTGAAIRC